MSFVRIGALVTAAALVAAAVAIPGAAGATTPVVTSVVAPAPVTAAVEAAGADANVAVSVLDTRTAVLYSAGDATTEFPTESVVKVLIAAYLLGTGQMSGTTESTAFQMITQSDDNDANTLWGQVGGGQIVAWAENRYGIGDLGTAPTESGWWGNTKFTTDGLVRFYAAVQADPVVGPWLLNAMGQMTATAADGTDQDFGLAAQTSTGDFKQGWGGDDDAFDSEQLNSTGVLDDRYAVAIAVQHVPYESMDDLLPVIDAVAAAVAPGGQVVPSPADELPSVAATTPSVSAATPPAGATGPTPASAYSPPAVASTAAADVSRPDVRASSPAAAGGVSRITAAARRLPGPLRIDALAGLAVLATLSTWLMIKWRPHRH